MPRWRTCASQLLTPLFVICVHSSPLSAERLPRPGSVNDALHGRLRPPPKSPFAITLWSPLGAAPGLGGGGGSRQPARTSALLAERHIIDLEVEGAGAGLEMHRVEAARLDRGQGGAAPADLRRGGELERELLPVGGQRDVGAEVIVTAGRARAAGGIGLRVGQVHAQLHRRVGARPQRQRAVRAGVVGVLARAARAVAGVVEVEAGAGAPGGEARVREARGELAATRAARS